MVETRLAQDASGFPIQEGGLRPLLTHQIDVIAASRVQASAFATDTQILELLPCVAMHIKLGGPTAEAGDTDMVIPSGLPFRVSVGDRGNDAATHIAARALNGGNTGKLYITELV